VGALPQALPLALGASFYPPAILVLLLLMAGPRPVRLVVAYLGGAALITVLAGMVALATFDDAGVTTRESRTASGWVYIVIGAALLGVAAWAWRRRTRAPAEATPSVGRIASWSRRATTSRRWAFVLGCVMYLPSAFYLLAVKTIADHGGSGTVLAVLICAATVLLFVEVPLVMLLVRPAEVAGALQRFQRWLSRNGWTVAAGVALAAGAYAIAKGFAALR